VWQTGKQIKNIKKRVENQKVVTSWKKREGTRTPAPSRPSLGASYPGLRRRGRLPLPPHGFPGWDPCAAQRSVLWTALCGSASRARAGLRAPTWLRSTAQRRSLRAAPNGQPCRLVPNQSSAPSELNSLQARFELRQHRRRRCTQNHCLRQRQPLPLRSRLTGPERTRILPSTGRMV